MTKSRTHNIVLAIGGLNGFVSTEVQNSPFVLRLKLSAKNPAHRQYAARYRKPYDDSANIKQTDFEQTFLNNMKQQLTPLLMPTQEINFLFLKPPLKNFMPPTLHTFAFAHNRTSQTQGQSQKSAIANALLEQSQTVNENITFATIIFNN